MEVQITPLTTFLAVVTAYRDRNLTRHNEIDHCVEIAAKRKGMVFHSHWSRDKEKKIWWSIQIPGGKNAPFVTVYRSWKDLAFSSALPRGTESALDHMNEDWAWSEATHENEDSYTTWNLARLAHSASVAFAEYILQHRDEVIHWINKEIRIDKSAYHCWISFVAEFKKRAAITGSMYSPHELEKAFQAFLESRIN